MWVLLLKNMVLTTKDGIVENNIYSEWNSAACAYKSLRKESKMMQTKKQSWHSQQLPFRLHQFRFFLVEQSASGSPSHMGFQSVRFFKLSSVVYHNSFRNDTSFSTKVYFFVWQTGLSGKPQKNIQPHILSIINAVGGPGNAAHVELSPSSRRRKYICRHLFRKAAGSLPGHPALSAGKDISCSQGGSGIK